MLLQLGEEREKGLAKAKSEKGDGRSVAASRGKGARRKEDNQRTRKSEQNQ